MPSNHTYLIEDGCSFQDFVFSCAKAFDYLHHMHEMPSNTPVPDIIRPDPYHAQKASEQLHALRAWRKLTLAEVRDMRATLEANRLGQRQLSAAADQAHRERYAAMRAQVEAWEPPTLDHQPLKEYMLSQIDRAARSYATKPDEPAPAEQTDQEWLDEQIAEALRLYDGASEEYLEATRRARICTAWVQQLKQSLKSVEAPCSDATE